MSVPFSFGFSKKVQQNKLVDSKLRDASTREEEEETDFVKEVIGNEIQGTLKKEKAKEWIIPLIKQNVWRREDEHIGTKSKETTNKSNDIPRSTPAEPLTAEQKLERQAIKELLAEANDNGDREETIYEVPLLLQNRIPKGYEEDENMDVSLRPEQSTLDDYDNFPVEQFGLAMLRGMGWKKTEGIGRTNKGVVELKEPTLRPKGLGLGAERPQANKDAVPSNTQNPGQSKLILKIGAFVLINKGLNKGVYGQVESFDEDNNRLIIKLALDGKMVAVSKFYIDLVSQEEYSQKSKILNLAKYERYKTSQEQNGGVHKRQSSDDERHSTTRRENHHSREDDDRLEEMYASRHDSKRKERSSDDYRDNSRGRDRDRSRGGDRENYRDRSRDREENSKSRNGSSRNHDDEEEHHSHRTKQKKEKKSKKHRRDSSSPRNKKSHKRKHHHRGD